MGNTSLSISFQPRSSTRDPRDLLIIEQGEVYKNQGALVKSSAIAHLLIKLYGFITGTFTYNCGLDEDGAFRTRIYVYPKIPELEYRFYASYGTLGTRIVREVTKTQTSILELDDSVDTKYLILSVVSVKWIGDVFDEDGSVIPSPSISTDGNVVSVSEKVYGTIKIVYTTLEHSYSLLITPRENAVEDKYASTVYGIYRDGLNWKDVEYPEMADPIANGDVECSLNIIVDITYDEEDRPVTDSGADRAIDVDYCSQEVKSDTIYAK